MAECLKCRTADADIQRWAGSEKTNMTISLCSVCFWRYFDERRDKDGNLTVAMRRRVQREFYPGSMSTFGDLVWPEMERHIPPERYSGPWNIGVPPWRTQSEATR